jgi:hypothetical protein
MRPRTVGALALRPTGNAQGGHLFFSLDTGRVITRKHWTELPLPAEVIERVHTFARRDHALPDGFLIADRYGNPIIDDDTDEDDDDSWHPDPDAPDPYQDDSHLHEYVDDLPPPP